MADEIIAVAPSASAPTVAPVAIKMESAPDQNGRSVLIQAVCVVDEMGRPVQPMTQELGIDLLSAIKELHACLANSTGDLAPSTRGIGPGTFN